MIPPIDLQGGALLAAARCASVMPLLSAFGTLAFRNLVAPRAFGRMPPETEIALKRRLLWLTQISIAAGLLGTVAWLTVEAGTLAEAGSVAASFAAIPTVLAQTAFGHVILLQVLALVVLAALVGYRDQALRQRIALGAGVVVVALQAGHSHAQSMYGGPSLLLACDVVHLLAAAAWLGGLLPLLLVVRFAPPAAGATAARFFSPLGQACIGALAATALFQGLILVASIPGLIGTAYGWMVMVKALLFGVLFGFAWFNRYRFAPALLRDNPAAARRIFLRSIFLQTGAALAIVVAAVLLSELPPAMHLQALWPFGARLSFAAVQEDPDFLHEVVWAGVAMAGALAVLAAALLLRRFRLPALAGCALVFRFALPHLDVLLVTAYPTSFYRSPTGFASETIVGGAGLFEANCAACHGAGGKGDGPLAKTLPVPPANLTASHLWMHSDGELFWWLTDGMRSPEGVRVMPGFADKLDEDQRWALIDYIRAVNAGDAFAATGAWPQPIRAPALEARCGPDILQLADLRGRFVRLVIGKAEDAPAAGSPAVTIGTVAGGGNPALCVARDENVAQAYAIVTGIPLAALPGSQFLIDEKGILRAVQRGGSGAAWDDPKTLAAKIMDLRDHPLSNLPRNAEMMKMPM